MLATLFAAGLTAIRIANPHDVSVDATLRCGEATRVVSVAAHDVHDVAEICAAPVIDSHFPLIALETRSDDGGTQRVLAANGECTPLTMAVPLFGCERGTATASLPAIGGATYIWSAAGATIVSGHGTPSIKLELSDAASARIDATITTNDCTRTASGAIAIRKPIVISTLTTPASIAIGGEITIDWTYAPGNEPLSQLLKGNAFAAPVTLTREQRSYTFKPQLAGMNDIELVASHGPSVAASLPRSTGKRRATSPTLITSTNCADARATRRFEVLGCDHTVPRLEAPKTADAGSTIDVSVNLAPSESAEWIIQNGTLLSEDQGTARILVADFVNTIEIRVRVTRGANCVVEPNVEIPVRPRPACASNPPAASVSLVSHACDTATVKATFNGVPPFRGTWSDGVTFDTNDTSITHDFTYTGTYTIGSFRDGQCYGTVAGHASLQTFGPTVTITSDSTCIPATVTAHFTGTPPFHGNWIAGQPFKTNEYSVTRVTNSLIEEVLVWDSECPNAHGRSNRLTFEESPAAFPQNDFLCVDQNQSAYATVQINSSRPPFSVRWSDGVLTTNAYVANWYAVLSRPFKTTKASETLTIETVSDAMCNAVVDRKDVTFSYRPFPEIDDTTGVVCAGKLTTISLEPGTLHPDATIVWHAANTEILSGQGTPSVTFIPALGTTPELFVKASYPDGKCDPGSNPQFWMSRRPYIVLPPAEISEFKVTPSTIKPGGTATFSFNRNRGVEGFPMSVTPDWRWKDLDYTNIQCTETQCTVEYRDTSNTPGEVALKFTPYGSCGSAPAETVILTIAP